MQGMLEWIVESGLVYWLLPLLIFPLSFIGWGIVEYVYPPILEFFGTHILGYDKERVKKLLGSKDQWR